ncbi:beta/alpha barrel domain-containing protein [Pseudomonas alkylphenolica]|jgi:hypothetical protein|uniref:hypothetical protein n=1 Tax=Pseudomonas alkylphenolica TaxID=237609 RepID=UPI0012F6AB33|nr:hypothetical protein [Pseudomonas alkylphenolica]
MPTENRSSNTAQMVSVPREPTPNMLAQGLKADGLLHKWYAMVDAAPAAQHQGEPVGWTYEDGKEYTACPDHAHDLRAEGIELTPVFSLPPTSDGFSPEQMTAQGADGYRNGIKAAAEFAADYPELAQAIRALPLPQ